MNKLIVIVGASGVGKTTLANALSAKREFAMAYEQHNERPFQTLFKKDVNYALANQLDYLLHRAEQERELRQSDLPAIMDGGLDLDFHGFTHLFHARGWLSNEEFELCRRFYEHTRKILPLPELIISLRASEETISARLALRNRINISSSENARDLDQFINKWLSSIPNNNILELDVSNEDSSYLKCVPFILDRM